MQYAIKTGFEIKTIQSEIQLLNKFDAQTGYLKTNKNDKKKNQEKTNEKLLNKIDENNYPKNY